MGTILQETDTTWLRFELPEPIVTMSLEADQLLTVVFETFESFRWVEVDSPGYIDGVFDITPTSFEPVLNFGATGYRVELR